MCNTLYKQQTLIGYVLYTLLYTVQILITKLDTKNRAFLFCFCVVGKIN